MPFYAGLKGQAASPVSAEDRRRTVEGLKRLRAQIRAEVPRRTLRETLLVATWNIRDFGNEDKRAEPPDTGPGPRLEESFYYMAEVLSAFDVIAVQELNTLDALQRVMDILGPSWDSITTDVTEGAAGNDERMTFVFDKRKVRPRGVAGQIVLTRGELLEGGKQFARTPYFVTFQSGWFKFAMCNVHIRYGKSYDDKGNPIEPKARIEEIDRIAELLAERARKTGQNIILLGDFNILSRTDATFQPFKKHGWETPTREDISTDPLLGMHYDQIGFRTRPGELHLGPSDPNSGTLNFFESVFREGEHALYYDVAAATGRPMKGWDVSRSYPENKLLDRKGYFEQQWRTWQMSDHYPLWIELAVDFTDEYLDRLAALDLTP